jgi:hypothetical protein
MYNFEEFTPQEIDILIEALDQWVAKDFSSKMMRGLTTALFSGNIPPDKRAEMERKEREKEEEEKKEKKFRVEQSIVMKAKLLKAKDLMEASSL